jgi:hypothetical protein
MRGAILFTGILMMLITACAAPPSTPQIVEPQTPLASATPLPPTPIPTDTQAATPTTRPSATATVPTPTETLLPPLDLPTLAVNPPPRSVWDGTPTYLADSAPGYAFRVLFDPEVWGLVTDQLGQPALGHRTIPYCIITPTQGRGLTPAMRVDHETIYPEELTIDVGRAYQNDALVFVTYQVSDGTVLTGFVVDFQEQSEACLADALAVISTLRSVPLSQATPQP